MVFYVLSLFFQTLYENSMTEFYQNSFIDMKNITVKMIKQPESSRLRSSSNR